jgi:hypothetical protein
MLRTGLAVLPLVIFAGAAAAQEMAMDMSPMVMAADQDVSNGIVSAQSVSAAENGWLVVHRTDAEMAPGPVVATRRSARAKPPTWPPILTEEVAPGDMLMLMVHSETGGTQTGVFEYTLGATEDGPIRIDDQLVMTVITAQ